MEDKTLSEPPVVAEDVNINSVTNTTLPINAQEQRSAYGILGSSLRGSKWLGSKALQIMESVGEVVISILGLEDSRFQDVLDGMTEEEMERAEQINQQREEEYRIHQERQQYRIYGDVESAPSTDNSFVSINNPSAVRPKETIFAPVSITVPEAVAVPEAIISQPGGDPPLEIFPEEGGEHNSSAITDENSIRLDEV
mmetsp:Transcript_7669/g.10589  ORF Transcript_7669/g.10589 Transcript_7669/m.10589 type:complete len:197 (-) Transcript_7669:116-706(-)